MLVSWTIPWKFLKSFFLKKWTEVIKDFKIAHT